MSENAEVFMPNIDWVIDNINFLSRIKEPSQAYDLVVWSKQRFSNDVVLDYHFGLLAVKFHTYFQGFDVAEKAFRRFLKVHPKHVLARTKLGRVLTKKGSHERDPQEKWLCYALAQGELEKAQEIYSNAPDRDKLSEVSAANYLAQAKLHTVWSIFSRKQQDPESFDMHSEKAEQCLIEACKIPLEEPEFSMRNQKAHESLIVLSMVQRHFTEAQKLLTDKISCDITEDGLRWTLRQFSELFSRRYSGRSELWDKENCELFLCLNAIAMPQDHIWPKQMHDFFAQTGETERIHALYAAQGAHDHGSSVISFALTSIAALSATTTDYWLGFKANNKPRFPALARLAGTVRAVKTSRTAAM